MLVNLDELSANELLELARKKQQQEVEKARAAAVVSRLAQLRKRREQLMADQERALAILEKELQALQQRRAQLVASHQSALAALDKEMAEVSASKDSVPEAVAPVAAAPMTVAPAPAAVAEPADASQSREGEKGKPDMAATILQLLKGRIDISEGFLRERLRSGGYDLAKLGKTLEQLVREGKLVNKGGGNYALKKRT
ncbi:MAG: hypothetical protein AB7U81_00900 [Thiohalomonadaceae bacterium]